MQRLLLRLITALAVAGIVGFGLRPLAQASSSRAAALTNPLLLTNPITGARAQMMPTTLWLKQHGISYGSAAGTANSINAPLSTTSSADSANQPTCILGADDSAGDAVMPLNGSQFQNDALD